MKPGETYQLTSKQEKIAHFSPDRFYPQLYSLPFSLEESEAVLIPVPWEVTCSYRKGTAQAPKAILEASHQMDLYDPDYPNGWQLGIFMLPIPEAIESLNNQLRPVAESCIAHQQKGYNLRAPQFIAQIQKINYAAISLNRMVQEMAEDLLAKNKLVGLIGGEHSVIFGFIKALARYERQFALLQLDAHADLRKAYEHFEFSHASIMYNILQDIPQVKQLVQVGLRDYSPEEHQRIQRDDRIHAFDCRILQRQLLEGVSWKSICEKIVEVLPEKVYVSVDIDVLDPAFCPNTGTPVKDGLTPAQLLYLIRTIVQSGRTIIGFDLCEVGSQGIDPIIAAQLLYKLLLLVADSQKRLC